MGIRQKLATKFRKAIQEHAKTRLICQSIAIPATAPKAQPAALAKALGRAAAPVYEVVTVLVPLRSVWPVATGAVVPVAEDVPVACEVSVTWDDPVV